jgi:hypothetical protein
MISWGFGFIYGLGFTLTLLGGFIWVAVLNTIHGSLHPLKVLGLAVVWPITLMVLGYRFYQYVKDEY